MLKSKVFLFLLGINITYTAFFFKHTKHIVWTPHTVMLLIECYDALLSYLSDKVLIIASKTSTGTSLFTVVKYMFHRWRRIYFSLRENNPILLFFFKQNVTYKIRPNTVAAYTFFWRIWYLLHLKRILPAQPLVFNYAFCTLVFVILVFVFISMRLYY